MNRTTRLVFLTLVGAVGACGGEISSKTEGESLGTVYPGAAGSGSASAYAPPASPGFAGGGDPLGVTPGGAKDIGYARDVIGKGGVPDGKAITVEGLLSEHDIPIPGPECQSLLCARPALGVAKALDSGQREHFIQLGFSSGFRRSTFTRPPLDVVVLIDRSAGMAIDQKETNAAVMSLVDKMRGDDRLGVLIFNDRVDTLFSFGKVTDKEALKKKVASVDARGGWTFQPAFEQAYRVLRAAGNDTGRLRRVMVFSCSYPSVSGRGDDPASLLIKSGASERIGLSFFGVLLGWDATLADLLGRVRGGAYYYLQDLAKIERVFDQDFDLMVTPVLYDLKIAVDPGARFEVVKLYGMPGMSAEDMVPQTGPPPPAANAGQGQTGGAFLSSRKGAIVARLRAREGAGRGGTVGTVSLRYEPEPALGFGDKPVEDKVPVVDVGEAQWDDEVFEGAGVHKAVTLTNQALRMRVACDAYHRDEKPRAAEILTELGGYFKNEAMAFGGELDAEVKLVEKLLANVAK